MAQIKVGDLTPRNQYTASSGQTAFSYAFPIFADADLKVYVGTTLQTLTTDYTVSGAGDDNGGTVTLVTGATTGDIITILRDMPVARTSDYQVNGDLLADTLNDDLDKLVMMAQQNESELSRKLGLQLDDEDATMTLPLKDTRATKMLGFDADGDPVMSGSTMTDIDASVAAAFAGGVLASSYQFTGTGSQVAFTITGGVTAIPNAQALIITIDGVTQHTDTYTTSAAVVTFSTAPPLNADIQIRYNAYLGTATDAASATYNQGGTGASSRTVENKLQESVSVKDFGAVGDGVTDDTAAIQAAIDDITSNQTLDLEQGEYLVSGLNIGAKTNIVIKNGKLTLSGTSAYGFRFNANTDNVKIENITIVGDANLASAQKGVYTETALSNLNTSIVGCDVSACMQNIDLGGHIGVFVRGCKIGATVGTSAGQGYGLAIGSGAQGVMVSDNYFYNTTRHALYFGNTSNGTAANNTFYRHRYGLGSSSSATLDISRSDCVSVVGNTFLECEGRCIGVSTDSGEMVTNIKISDNVMKDTIGSEMQIGPSTTTATAYLLGISITDNVFYPLPSVDNSNRTGILLQSGKKVQISNNLFNMDNSYSNTRNVISIGADAGAGETNDITITGNSGNVSGTDTRLVSIASALCTGSEKISVYNNNAAVGTLLSFGTPPTNSAIKSDSLLSKTIALSAGSQTLNIAGYNRFYITGDSGGSTITDFVNGYDDKEVEIRFGDANTTVNRDNAKLNGGVNFTSTSHDMLSLRQILTVWFELNRSANS